MKKLLLSVLMLLMCSFCFAQHLTYSTFMKVIKKTERVSEFNDAIGAYGYNYGGSYISDKGNENETQYTFWLKNCHHIESTSRVEWERGIDRSFLVLVYKPSGRISGWANYTFHSKSAYKTFISTAKQNGFIFKNDGLEDSFIYIYFERINKSKQHKECMKFLEYTDQEYKVMYWIEGL